MSEQAESQGGAQSEPPRKGLGRILPKNGTVGYHVMLGTVAIVILGPLGGITAAYMNFSLGFFVGGQVLAGILGSVVTYGYGPEGKHGANYMQTMAASVASMGAMGVLVQAMVWLGLPIPPAWQMIIYFLCVGMLGVGIGMLYTPLLVDRMQLTYPSGLAVANILRALTDKRLLKRSVSQLGSGTGIGFFLAFLPEKVKAFGWFAKAHFEGSAVGAGMIVGARIGIPAIVVAVIGKLCTPWLREIHYLGPDDAYRKVGFLIALGTIMGAALVDLTFIFRAAIVRFREQKNTKAPPAPADSQNFSSARLIIWTGVWGVATILAGSLIMKAPVLYLCFGVALCFLFVLVNGISQGISDSNPISSAFVLSVLLMALVGLKDPGVGLLCGAILLIACSVGCDMQQDRSTGWRLGSNRRTQFRYQVIGVTMGAVCAVGITSLFMKAYPELKINTLDFPKADVGEWSSAMTFKFVGALKGITNPNPKSTKLLLMGLAIGLVTEGLRKFLKGNDGYKKFRDGSKGGYAFDFFLDCVLLPSPYASSFGGFVNFSTAMYFGGGGVAGSLYNTFVDTKKEAPKKEADKPAADGEKKDEPAEIPEDMSTVSLVGGGMIAGESLSALAVGVIGLVSMLGEDKVDLTGKTAGLAHGSDQGFAITDKGELVTWGAGGTFLATGSKPYTKLRASGAWGCATNDTATVDCLYATETGSTRYSFDALDTPTDVTIGDKLVCAASKKGIQCVPTEGGKLGAAVKVDGLASADVVVSRIGAEEGAPFAFALSEGEIYTLTVVKDVPKAKATGVKNIRTIAAGSVMQCSSTEDGVTCGETPGKGSLVAGLGSVKQLVAGGELACALDAAGLVSCWSLAADSTLETTPITLPNAAEEIGVWDAHACARLTDGNTHCWGSAKPELTRTAGSECEADCPPAQAMFPTSAKPLGK